LRKREKSENPLKPSLKTGNKPGTESPSAQGRNKPGITVLRSLSTP